MTKTLPDFDIINLSKIPTKKIKKITDEPLIWRYFVTPLPTKLATSEEAAIRIIEPNLETVWAPKGGEPVIIKMERQ